MENKARTGGWVRWGDDGKGNTTIQGSDGKPATVPAIFHDFLAPAIAAGHGVHVKNLYNLYVYFWRWALWKVFEHETAVGPGVVSFISASSYLDGDAFCGMREHMRRDCDEIWILDLGGEGRGTRRDENIFAIQTPVAVAIAFCQNEPDKKKPARAHYARIEGTREEKLAALNSIAEFKRVKWQDCPHDWKAAFRPAGKGSYFAWPLLTELMPWQHSGAQLKRTWPICPEVEVLKRRWRALLTSPDRAVAFKESRDRKITSKCPALVHADETQEPIEKLPRNALPPPVERYAYRSFDRQWVLADSRLGDFLRPELWRAHGGRQVYLTSLLTKALGRGPAVTGSGAIPDLDHFSGRGAKDVIPLYRTADASEPNISPGFLALLAKTYERRVTPQSLLAYIYGVLAQPAFTSRFERELGTRELRVPITRDAGLFENVREIGARLLWLHTYGEGFVPRGAEPGYIPPGAAKCTKPVPGDPNGYPQSFKYNDATNTLRVGEGEFSPVGPEVLEFEVSGLKVVQSWLKYRMKAGTVRKSSPLDEIRPDRWTSRFTTELLELLWVLEATVALYPEQAKLLKAVVSGACFQANDLPQVTKEMRKPPKAQRLETSVLDFNRNS